MVVTPQGDAFSIFHEGITRPDFNFFGGMFGLEKIDWKVACYEPSERPCYW